MVVACGFVIVGGKIVVFLLHDRVSCALKQIYWQNCNCRQCVVYVMLYMRCSTSKGLYLKVITLSIKNFKRDCEFV